MASDAIELELGSGNANMDVSGQEPTKPSTSFKPLGKFEWGDGGQGAPFSFGTSHSFAPETKSKPKPKGDGLGMDWKEAKHGSQADDSVTFRACDGALVDPAGHVVEYMFNGALPEEDVIEEDIPPQQPSALIRQQILAISRVKAQDEWRPSEKALEEIRRQCKEDRSNSNSNSNSQSNGKEAKETVPMSDGKNAKEWKPSSDDLTLFPGSACADDPFGEEFALDQCELCDACGCVLLPGSYFFTLCYGDGQASKDWPLCSKKCLLRYAQQVREVGPD